MQHTVIITVAPPGETAALDALQIEGVAAILGQVIDRAREAVTPDGSRVQVTDRWVGSHPEGAVVAIVVQAASPENAATAVQALVQHIITTSHPLADWTITGTEVNPAPGQAVHRPIRSSQRHR